MKVKLEKKKIFEINNKNRNRPQRKQVLLKGLNQSTPSIKLLKSFSKITLLRHRAIVEQFSLISNLSMFHFERNLAKKTTRMHIRSHASK
jgi:hypothetical protein